MKIFLIRHGETEANIDSTKSAILSSKGKKQIDVLAKRLADFNLDAIYSSDLDRAQATAKEIYKFNKEAEYIETEELREIYRLIIGGVPKEGTRPNRFEEDLERSEKFWEKMLKWDYKKVAIVCHGNIIRFFLAKALDIDPKKALGFMLDPASVSILKVGTDKVRIILMNDIGHIPTELLSENSMYVE